MTVSNDVIAAWLVLVSVLLSLFNNLEDNHRRIAERLDLKIVKNQITGQTRTIPKMGMMRNENRRIAETYEKIVLFLSVAAAIGAIAISVSGLSRSIIFMISIVVCKIAGLTYIYG